MGRTEYTLFTVVGALLVFVGVQIVRAPHAAQAPAAAPVDTAAAGPRLQGGERTLRQNEVSAQLRASAEPPPERNVAEVRQRIANESMGTYMPDMLADGDSMLVRWPDRRIAGLRIWVQPQSSVAGWTDAYAQMARSVFDEWQTAGLPMRLDMVLDSAGSDVQVTWIDRFPPQAGRRIGNTRRTTDQYGWLVAANIIVALHDSAGRTFTPPELAGIVRHEAGHALGLGHSRDRTTMMYPEETVHDIAPADRATLRLLYALPPGSLR